MLWILLKIIRYFRHRNNFEKWKTLNADAQSLLKVLEDLDYQTSYKRVNTSDIAMTSPVRNDADHDQAGVEN